jgi:hypothetical protein
VDIEMAIQQGQKQELIKGGQLILREEWGKAVNTGQWIKP